MILLDVLLCLIKNNTRMDRNEVSKPEVVLYEEWVNKHTGEVRTFAVVSKKTGDNGFHKVWLDDLAKVMNILGGGKLEVFGYIIQNINPYSNEFGGTIREVAQKTGIDEKTVQRTINLLKDADFLKKVRTGTYLINSKKLVQGGQEKKNGIMVIYNSLSEC